MLGTNRRGRYITLNQILVDSLVVHLRQIAGTPNATHMPFDALMASSILERIATIARSVEKNDPQVSIQLLRAKDLLFYTNQFGQAMLNPYALGEVIFGLDYIVSKQSPGKSDSFMENELWSYVHPLILKSSKTLYLNGHYANAAEDAFIEINDRVKRLFAIVRPGENVPDGEAAMTTVFSAKNPLVEFCDLGTTTGLSKQKGYMQMLAGAMSALRNPKAHSNAETINDQEAYRRLVTASMLMYAIDEAVQYSGIAE